jgi:hypothetical protein
MNGVFIIPTGIGCKIGGDAAANVQVKIIASCCENLIVNPNAVNASDINELTENCLYVEGSHIDRFLNGEIGLKLRRGSNKILLVVNKSVTPDSINAMNAARHALGCRIEIVELDTPLIMTAMLNDDGSANGTYSGVDELVEQIREYEYDALAIHTPISCEDEIAVHYWKNGGVNPWGAVEAITSKAIASKIRKPIAHGPLELFASASLENLYSKSIVKPSMAPEAISCTNMFCVYKGLSRAPKLVTHDEDLSNIDIDFLVTPVNCWGKAHEACLDNEILIIVVKENTTIYPKMSYQITDKIIFVNTYLEAAGLIMAISQGIDPRIAVFGIE